MAVYEEARGAPLGLAGAVAPPLPAGLLAPPDIVTALPAEPPPLVPLLEPSLLPQPSMTSAASEHRAMDRRAALIGRVAGSLIVSGGCMETITLRPDGTYAS